MLGAMQIRSVLLSVVAASSLVFAEPIPRYEGLYERSSHHGRIPSHHVPEEYLSLFDPARHDRITAEIKSHQDRILPTDEYGSMQHVLNSVIPTSERAALQENMVNIREQCKHASKTIKESLSLDTGNRKVLSRRATNEVAGSNLVGATAFAVIGAIGVAALML